MGDHLTFLSSPRTVGSKTFTPAGKIDFDAGPGPFEVQRFEIADPAAALELLRACPSNAFVVRGQPIEQGAAFIPYRKSRQPDAKDERPPTLEREAHELISIDWDGDPDPLVDATNIIKAAEHARSFLPPSFAGAGCLIQATSSAGIKPGYRVRLWFWGNRAVSDAELKSWLSSVPQVDKSIYQAQQPIYVAPPTFVQVNDPFAHLQRWAFLPGGAVLVPENLHTEPDRVHSPIPESLLRELTADDRAYAEGAVMAWESDCASRDTTPGKPHRAWYNHAVFALGTRAWVTGGVQVTQDRVIAGIRKWKARQYLVHGDRDPVSESELLHRALDAFADGCARPWRPTVAAPVNPEAAAAEIAPVAPKPSTEKAERALRRQGRRLRADPTLLVDAIERVAEYVVKGQLTARQVANCFVEDIEAGPDSAPVNPNKLCEDVQTAADRWKAAEERKAQETPTLSAVRRAALTAGMATDPQTGEAMRIPANLQLLMRNHKDVIDVWWNKREGREYWITCPWRDVGPVQDSDETAFTYWLSKELGWHQSPVAPFAAIHEAAMLQAADPWLEALKGLQWDGVHRLHDTSMTSELLGCEDTALNRKIFEWWMISAAARSFEPGAQVDHVMILEGEQGTGKTSFLRELAMHPCYFSRLVAGEAFSNVRTIRKIHGPAIVEIAEMAALTRSERNAVKAFIDEREDRVQYLHAKKMVNEPRRCVFVGTTNDSEYLDDPTGGRRWWPITTTMLNLDLLRAVKAQLWAEAVHLYQAGVPWWPSKEDRAPLAELAATRMTETPGMDHLASKLAALNVKPGYDAMRQEHWYAEQFEGGALVRLTVSQAAKLLDLHPSRDVKAATNALRSLGWVRDSTRSRNSGRQRFWRAPGAIPVKYIEQPVDKAPKPN